MFYNVYKCFTMQRKFVQVKYKMGTKRSKSLVIIINMNNSEMK